MYKDFDITKTKLIVWDLDDTFWEGTLSEGGIKFKEENLRLVEELITKGIMNSICSKNDSIRVKSEFIVHGYLKQWQNFIFPSINWSAKGQRVKSIIDSMQLREENVIVIDDNITNIQEIKYYCPNIMSATPNQIPKIAKELYLLNEYDLEHVRLRQYKVLEAKNRDKLLSNSSNEEFLKNSEIKICIKRDCADNIERIERLILRTNQLNFTKKRVNQEILKRLFSQPEKYDSAYIIAEDKYGSYGICGFYVLDKTANSLEHFLFSCRIMNMGIEQFVYNYLNSPKIQIIPPVSSNLGDKVDWIEIVENLELIKPASKNETDLNILFKGACDLYSTVCYIDGDCNIDTEFPYWNKKLLYISSHTHPAFIEQTNRLSKEELIGLTEEFPNPQPEEFETEFFNPKYKVVVLSLLQATFRGIYINKQNGHYAEYGFTSCDVTDEKNWDRVLAEISDEYKDQNRQVLREFSENYVFAGNPPIELLMKNLKYIRENLSKDTNLILILGSEVDTKKMLSGYEGVCEQHFVLNKYVREFAKQYENVDIVEITDLITSDDDYTDCINHFSRRVYAEIARKIIDIINKTLGKEYLFLKTENESHLCTV